ncbi:hypothetical protein LCGC14_1746650 [marine sediment metagenome]|uniref:Uncharacterized protein n=1 Tax=marine sediment metagenome TaxID=412755 RepID=A0A0F9JK92_9ZZZZ|nr:hypothetical protein [Pseudoalteromonas prydzensis]
MNIKLLLLLGCSFIIGCVEQQAEPYLSVTPFNFIHGPDKSVVISFGESPQNYYSIAIKKLDVKEGTELYSESKSNMNFAVFGDINEETLMSSENLPTYARVKVISVDARAQKAVFEVEATLLNLDTGELKKLDRVEVIVRGDDFLLLI